MCVYTDEIFGPVLGVLRVDTLDEAIDLINRNTYANGVAIFTSSGHAAREFQRRVQVGMIGVNVPIPVPMAFYSLRRLEGLAVRRPPHPRPRGRPLLHARQGGHDPLAGPGLRTRRTCISRRRPDYLTV